jgi:hypothetical protein
MKTTSKPRTVTPPLDSGRLRAVEPVVLKSVRGGIETDRTKGLIYSGEPG